MLHDVLLCAMCSAGVLLMLCCGGAGFEQCTESGAA